MEKKNVENHETAKDWENLSEKEVESMALQTAFIKWNEHDETSDNDFFYMVDKKWLGDCHWDLYVWNVNKLTVDRKKLEEDHSSSEMVYIDRVTGLEIPIWKIILELESPEMVSKRKDFELLVKKEEIKIWKKMFQKALSASNENESLLIKLFHQSNSSSGSSFFDFFENYKQSSCSKK